MVRANYSIKGKEEMKPIKSVILPLDGKYYGTYVEVTYPDGNTSRIKVWVGNDYTPSPRQLRHWGLSAKDWDNNVEIPDGWGGMERVREADYTSDGHFESVSSWELALMVTGVVNG
jgi:hypothetical protein